MRSANGVVRRGRRLSRLALAVVAVCSVTVGGLAQAPQIVPHKTIKSNFQAYNKEVVFVQGWVTAEKKVPEATSKGFYLRDRFGDLMLIRTTQVLPEINTEVRIKGVALFDDATREPYVMEEERESLKVPVVGPGKVVGVDVSPEATKTPEALPAGTSAAAVATAATTAETVPMTDIHRTSWYMTWPYLTGFGAVGVLLLVGAFVLLGSRRKPALDATGPDASPSDAWANPYAAPSSTGDLIRPVPGTPAPAGTAVVEDFKTVKAYKTNKVLPGRLVVLEGQRETDIVHLSDQSGTGEIEIGRDSPDATSGIRIKDKTNTLSRHQAKLTYDSAKREFRVLNLVGDRGNATLINGRPMHENEAAVLKDDDVLGMGSVELKFKTR